MDLYAENILDHYKNPHHKGHLNNATTSFSDSNPLCGDKITIELLIEKGMVVDAAFTGEGCAISQASASILMDEIIGKGVSDLQHLKNEDIFAMIGVPLSPSRVKCGLLCFTTLKKALTLLPRGNINISEI